MYMYLYVRIRPNLSTSYPTNPGCTCVAEILQPAPLCSSLLIRNLEEAAVALQYMPTVVNWAYIHTYMYIDTRDTHQRKH